jgi:UDP:flavonoid glycosyltransferase YjiC (YdhE family)
MVEADLAALGDYRPDGVFCGLNISSMISTLRYGAPRVTMVPTSLCPAFYRKGLASFPNTMERSFISRYLIPGFLKRRFFNAVMLKDVMRNTAATFNGVRERYGLPPIGNMIDFIQADLILLPDLPELSGLPREDLPPPYVYTGPIFAHMDLPIPDSVHRVYSREGLKVFLSLGSSGSAEILQQVARLLRAQRDINTVCATTEIMTPEELGPPAENFAAFRYLPSHRVNEMADVAVTHGGAGTLQTAAWAGTPVVGIGFQAEQQANLEGLAKAGMAVRIPLHAVSARRLLGSVRHVARSCRETALRVRALVRAHNGVAESVRLMGELLASGIRRGIQGSPE